MTKSSKTRGPKEEALRKARTDNAGSAGNVFATMMAATFAQKPGKPTKTTFTHVDESEGGERKPAAYVCTIPHGLDGAIPKELCKACNPELVTPRKRQAKPTTAGVTLAPPLAIQKALAADLQPEPQEIEMAKQPKTGKPSKVLLKVIKELDADTRPKKAKHPKKALADGSLPGDKPAKAQKPLKAGALAEPKYIKDPHNTKRAAALLAAIKKLKNRAKVDDLIIFMQEAGYKDGTTRGVIYDLNYDGWITRVEKGIYGPGPRLG